MPGASKREIVFTILQAAKASRLGEVTVAKAAAHLESLGNLREVTGRPSNKLFAYDRYLALLQEGTEPGE